MDSAGRQDPPVGVVPIGHLTAIDSCENPAYLQVAAAVVEVPLHEGEVSEVEEHAVGGCKEAAEFNLRLKPAEDLMDDALDLLVGEANLQSLGHRRYD